MGGSRSCATHSITDGTTEDVSSQSNPPTPPSTVTSKKLLETKTETHTRKEEPRSDPSAASSGSTGDLDLHSESDETGTKASDTPTTTPTPVVGARCDDHDGEENSLNGIGSIPKLLHVPVQNLFLAGTSNESDDDDDDVSAISGPPPPPPPKATTNQNNKKSPVLVAQSIMIGAMEGGEPIQKKAPMDTPVLAFRSIMTGSWKVLQARRRTPNC